MTLPNRFQTVLEIAEKFGVPDPSDDEGRRAFVRKVVEQLQYSYPQEHWGTKRSGPGAPPSKDVVATQSPFEGADIQLGNGNLCWNEHNASNDPYWAAQAPYWFTYPAVNHLAPAHVDVPHSDVPQHEDVPTEPPGQVSELVQIFLDLTTQISALRTELAQLKTQTYEGSAQIPLLGTARFTLTPTKPKQP